MKQGRIQDFCFLLPEEDTIIMSWQAEKSHQLNRSYNNFPAKWSEKERKEKGHHFLQWRGHKGAQNNRYNRVKPVCWDRTPLPPPPSRSAQLFVRYWQFTSKSICMMPLANRVIKEKMGCMFVSYFFTGRRSVLKVTNKKQCQKPLARRNFMEISSTCKCVILPSIREANNKIRFRKNNNNLKNQSSFVIEVLWRRQLTMNFPLL